MLADQVDHVIGVDTHRDSHAAAVVAAPSGALELDTTIVADPFGYKRLLRFARQHARGRRVWAIESSGSFGAGLAMFLLEQGRVGRGGRAAGARGAA
jgi:transposase